MKLEGKLILIFTLIIFFMNMINTVLLINSFYLDGLNYFITDFHQEMMRIHIIILIGSLGCFFGIFLRNFWGKVLSIISATTIFGVYVWWYFEKFEWIEVTGLKKGTIGYTKRLNEIGWFRGANEWDFVMLFSALVLLMWILFRYKTNSLKPLQ